MFAHFSNCSNYIHMDQQHDLSRPPLRRTENERRSEYYSVRGCLGKEVIYLAMDRMKSSPASHCNWSELCCLVECKIKAGIWSKISTNIRDFGHIQNLSWFSTTNKNEIIQKNQKWNKDMKMDLKCENLFHMLWVDVSLEGVINNFWSLQKQHIKVI